MDIVLNTDTNRRYFLHGIPITRDRWNRHVAGTAAAPPSGEDSAARLRFARLLAAAINETSDFSREGTRPARAGELFAMILLHEAFHYLVARYCRNAHPGVIEDGLAAAAAHNGPETVEQTLLGFVRLYPPMMARERALTPVEYLQGTTVGIAHRHLAAEEILLLQIAVENTALLPYRPLFDHAALRREAPYDLFMEAVSTWLEGQPPFPGTGLSLLSLLRAPLRAHPDSIEDQLGYIMGRWQAILPPELLGQLRVAQGTLREESRMRGAGPGPTLTLAFNAHDYAEPEAFSQDEDWMSDVVLLAKLVYVWLDQLSRKYGRILSRLDDIPDEELDRLAGWGFNALWLIGVWERSSASRDIKQRMGNPDAASSAYSLYDYTISNDLGGEAAFNDLARRAGQRGIRLAGDMVPNHMGLNSKWVIEAPHRFLQLREPPFPTYRFTGPDLSNDDRVGLYIEDGYWNHSDAAVVFKRVDHWTGDVCYIYHGNDGTSMPWNDTAQLNFLLRETREAVIQTILHTARMFPIIRFDAAMTLAKKHYQRLWFPKPGDGGAIPSRAEHGLSRAEFDQVFPEEFWREVVDRVAAEAPDTLLLAEAFWLMEGYFVRTLGMHRVYNSAFMNMLKTEDNAKYRQTIKNVLEFSPEVLQRFVNFMNNPDEDTAEAQFGKGDKYFGVAAMLVTMPGLPMIGHGQIEGFTEKYGMEYRNARRDETPDQWFVDRHEREIFPLMRKRRLFSNARNFALFDFVTPEGWVDENVFAYGNRAGNECALIVYNNVHGSTHGVLCHSTAINEGRGDQKALVRRSLTQALALHSDPRHYSIFRDARTGLEYLYHNATLAESGLHLELHEYEYKALFFCRDICDEDQSWGRLHAHLAGGGVESVEEAYLEMHLSSILNPFREFMTAEMLTHVLTGAADSSVLGPWRGKLAAFFTAINERREIERDVECLVDAVEGELATLRRIMEKPTALMDGESSPPLPPHSFPPAEAPPKAHIAFWRVPATYIVLRSMGRLADPERKKTAAPEQTVEAMSSEIGALMAPAAGNHADADYESVSAAWMKEWLLLKHIERAFHALDGDAWRAQQDARMAYLCVAHRGHFAALDTEIWGPLLHSAFEDPVMRAALLVNRFSGRRFLNKEQLEQALLALLLAVAVDSGLSGTENASVLAVHQENARDILFAAADTEYDFDWMLNVLK